MTNTASCFTPTSLSVNLNKVALIRNSREGNTPDIAEFGQLCIDNGANGLTVHPRPDQRHIRPNDVYTLANLVAGYPDIEFNIEGNPFAENLEDFPGFLALVAATRPHQCTLVPDSNDQLTSDHGFNLHKDGEKLRPIIQSLQQSGIRVSLFMDPDPLQITLAKEIGADRIELYTGPFAQAHKSGAAQSVLDAHITAAQTAIRLGLGVNAGHDLNLDNLADYRQVPQLLEVSIGHALTLDALRYGMPEAIRRYLAICQSTRV